MTDPAIPTELIEWLGFLAKYVISPAVVFLIIGKIYGLGELGQKFNSALIDIEDLKSNTNDLKKVFARIENDITVIKTYLTSSFGLKDTLFSSNSPIQLTPKGESLLEAANFKAIFADNKEVFMHKVEGYKHTTPAEIDEACTAVLNSMKGSQLLSNFKSVAYEAGIPEEVLIRTCAIYVRNEAIKLLLQ